ncbi:hypothetical protein [Pelomonas sp. Root1444]|uniref:hypothetical protein n=1 Tax=Pelomonas sp. Root1444 TaxID=1736464 RepID=UPI0012FC24DB|nr:hypothetical protein [Pelomonas sp. Root1444]
MNISVEDAARHLQKRFSDAPGLVNTMAFFDASGPFIRVLVDPSYWRAAGTVPRQFEGYRVVTERRAIGVADRLH